MICGGGAASNVADARCRRLAGQRVTEQPVGGPIDAGGDFVSVHGRVGFGRWAGAAAGPAHQQQQQQRRQVVKIIIR